MMLIRVEVRSRECGGIGFALHKIVGLVVAATVAVESKVAQIVG